MLARCVLNPILDDEALTRHLGDSEARLLVEWLVDQAEHLGEALPEDAVTAEVRRLCLRGRAIARFVRLWCMDELRGRPPSWPPSKSSPGPCPMGRSIPAD